MKPEEKARQEIAELLGKADWKVQNYRELDLGAPLGVAVREFPLKSGDADYLLYVDRKPVGAIEAKSQGTTLSGVEDQTVKYVPETLHEWLAEEDTLEGRLKKIPPLIKTGLRDCQIEAIENLEKSFADSRPKVHSYS